MAYYPSWKDRIVSLGTTAATKFRIFVSISGTSTLVYEGVAQPLNGSVNVNVRDIVTDYLALAAPSLTRWTSASCPDVTVLYTLQKYVSSAWTDVESGRFILDGTYDTGRALTSADALFMHAPIITRAAQWQFLFYEAMDTTAVNVTRDTASSVLGSTANTIYSQVFGDQQEYEVSGVRIYQDNARSIEWTAGCGDFALYYANALGGWDTLLLEGNCTRSAAVERSTFAKVYDNGTVTNANVKNYQNAVTDKYTLRTGWLTDDESSRMFHLLGSTQVFLHDHGRSLILPVRLTDTSFDYKTFKSQGGKLIQYTMNATVLRDYIRR